MTDQGATTTTTPSSWILVESMRPIDPDDVDFFIMFMESKRHSGGGDLTKYECVDGGCLYKMTYEDTEARDRVLSKRFLKFKNYLLRATTTENSLCDHGPLDTSSLIIKNFPSQNGDDDEQLIRLYADYLQADNNEIVSIKWSRVFTDACLVTYSNPVDRDTLKQRHQKRCVVNQSEIRLLDVYSTRSLIVCANNTRDTYSKLAEFIRDRVVVAGGEQQDLYFVKSTDQFILIECSSDQLCQRIRSLLSELSTQTTLCVDYIYNRELLNNYQLPKMTDNDKSKSEVEHQTENKKVDVVQQTIIEPIVTLDDPTLPLTITLINCNQALTNLNQFLHNKNLIAERKKKTDDSSSSSSSSIWIIDLSGSNKVATVNEMLKQFQAVELGQDVIRLQSRVSTQLPFDLVQAKMDEKMSRFTSICFFDLDRVNQRINCYGVKKHLDKHVGLLRHELQKLELVAAAAAASSATNNDIKVIKATNPPEDNGKITIQPNTALYVCLKELSSIRTMFESKLAELDCKLVMKDQHQISLVYKSLSCKEEINSLIRRNEESLLTLQRLNLTVMFGIKTKEQQTRLNEFKKQIYGAFQRPRAFGYRFETDHDNSQDFVVVYGLKSSVENFKSEARKKYINMVNSKQVVVGGGSNSNHQVNKSASTTSTASKDQTKTTTSAVDEHSSNGIDNYKTARTSFEFTKEDEIIINQPSSIEFIVLKHFNGKYFDELVKMLADFDYTVEEQRRAATSSQQNEINSFKVARRGGLTTNVRQSLNKSMAQFFSRFIQREIDTARKSDLSRIKLNPLMIHTEWTQQDRLLRLTGLLPEVNRVVKALGGKNKPTASILSQFSHLNGGVNDRNNINNKTEKFLINELKWYQTRILFEKKYFEYVEGAFGGDLQVTLSNDMSTICYAGRRSDIDKAKQRALDILGQILGAEIECEPRLIDRIADHTARYESLMRQEKICCVLDANKSTSSSPTSRLTIYGTSVEDIKKCHDLLLATN